MVEENIGASNCLVKAVEARMPSMADITEAEGVERGLVDESVLQTMKLPERFAHDFLWRARRPRFHMIAPGLEVLTISKFSDQPCRSHISNLYQPVYQPSEQQHEQSLVDVLESWRGIVERGDWQIDENGVAGSIDVWREADTEDKWERYVIPRAVGEVER